MTQRRFLARGKAVAAAALVSASILGATPAMAGPVTCTDVPTAAACVTSQMLSIFVGPSWHFGFGWAYWYLPALY